MTSHRYLSDPDECKKKGDVFHLGCQYDNSNFRKSKTRLTVLISYQTNSPFNLLHGHINL